MSVECYLCEEKKNLTDNSLSDWLLVHNHGYHRKPIMPNCERFENGVKENAKTLANNSLKYNSSPKQALFTKFQMVLLIFLVVNN
jgi:hypothetical protein